MSFVWESHHFINRVPCLDLANTVVWRDNPGKTDDRLGSLKQLSDWVAACEKFGGLTPHCLDRPSLRSILRIRAAADDYFRSGQGWPRLVQLYAASLTARGTALERSLLHGAFALAFSEDAKRVKVCGNCGWLFIDRTRNQNKRWCISALCGNRTKARRYYAQKVTRKAKPSI
jgi:predicted RNA-binding Zn ribbon-like protein